MDDDSDIDDDSNDNDYVVEYNNDNENEDDDDVYSHYYKGCPKNWQFLSNADVTWRVEKLNILEDLGYCHID